jgi:predicted nucleic acid-binding protein
MTSILSYLDSGVLIAASRGNDLVSAKASLILDSKNRVFCCSNFVKLEILTKAKYHKQEDEVNFYETFFASCSIWATDYPIIMELGENLASKYGLNALDALQVASAISVKADQFLTTEKSTKPLHRVTEIATFSLADN